MKQHTYVFFLLDLPLLTLKCVKITLQFICVYIKGLNKCQKFVFFSIINIGQCLSPDIAGYETFYCITLKVSGYAPYDAPAEYIITLQGTNNVVL